MTLAAKARVITTQLGRIAPPSLTVAQAELLTARFREAVTVTADSLDAAAQYWRLACELAIEAYQSRVWEVLQDESFESYCAERIPAIVRLPREVRRELTVRMSEAGMSTRAIAPVLGVNQATAVRDRSSTDASASVEPEPAQPADAPAPIVGLNGKTYVRPVPKPPPPPPAPPVESIAERDRREYLNGVRRTGDAVRNFLFGWDTAINLHRNPSRDDVLAYLEEYDRTQFLAIETEQQW